MTPIEPVDTGARARGSERPLRTPSGPGFALPAALGAGVVAAILAFVGVLVFSQLAASNSDDGASLDPGGVAAARLFAARDLDSWDSGFGTMGQIHEKLDSTLKAERAKLEDTRDQTLFDSAVEEWKQGKFETRSPYVPGFDKIFGAKDEATIEDTAIRNALRRGVEAAMKDAGATLIGAALISNSKGTLATAGNALQASGPPLATYGDTKVFAASHQGQRVRIYEHPAMDRYGNPAGKAVVAVYAPSPPDVVGAAAAGGGAAFLGAFLVALILCMRPVKALQKLAAETDAVARGEFATRISTRGPETVTAVAKGVQRLAALAAEGGGGEPQIVEKTVQVAPTADIQAGLAPMRSMDRPANLEIESTSKACPAAGNDYFDVIRVDDDHTGFFIADIPLHGVAGALYMAQVRALFRSEAVRSASPADVLKAVNRAFAVDLPRGIYVTALYAVIEHSTGICRMASAQHLPLVFWKRAKKGSAKVQGEGIALGLDAGPVFDKTLAEKAIQMEPGDRIVLFTDGAISAKNASGATYGEEKFYYVVNREAPKNSAAFVNFVANDVDLFHAGAPQLDDFTILTARRMK